MERFPTVASAILDKGFHSPADQRGLAEVIDYPVLLNKGTCSAAEREREGDPRFIHLRRKHAAVESAINALEVHGIDGFRRYVALVVARNIQRIGALLLAQEAEEARREGERQRRRRAA